MTPSLETTIGVRVKIGGQHRKALHELVTSDAPKATKFYTDLFGSTVKEMPTPTGGDPPGLLARGRHGRRRHGRTCGGAVRVAGASAKTVGELGGKVTVPPTTVPDML